MKSFMTCRRTFVSTLAITFLFLLGLRGVDVAGSLAAVAMGLAAANAGEAAYRKKDKQ